MKIELKPGERVSVTFADSDGEIEISFNKTSIKVHADLPDTQGRHGTIYSENFDAPLGYVSVLKKG